MIHYLKGDATKPVGSGHKILVHSCNDRGKWGRGFVLAISRRWPQARRAYLEWFDSQENFILGAVQYVKVEPELWIANMIGQHGLISRRNPQPAKLEAFKSGLALVAEEARTLKASIHMPRIGCHLGGLTWDLVEPVISKSLASLEVFVYDLAQ